MEQTSDRSTAWQVLQRIYRFSLPANFKMKLHPVGSRGTHLGNRLPGFDLLSLLNQQPAVMSVGTYVGIAVFDDQQLAVAP
jgi:hypothetical protein